MKTKVKPIELTTILEFFVAGVKFYDYQQTQLKAGDKLTLTWERSNQYDKNAIRVDFQRTKLGYVPRELTHKLHWERLAGRKVTAIVRSFNKSNPSWETIRVKVTALRGLGEQNEETKLTTD